MSYCDDCLHKEVCGLEGVNEEALTYCADKMLKKTGHWIDITNKFGTVIAVRCSNCKNSPKHAIKSDYCPNCGARMLEQQESEVRNE